MAKHPRKVHTGRTVLVLTVYRKDQIRLMLDGVTEIKTEVEYCFSSAKKLHMYMLALPKRLQHRASLLRLRLV